MSKDVDIRAMTGRYPNMAELPHQKIARLESQLRDVTAERERLGRQNAALLTLLGRLVGRDPEDDGAKYRACFWCGADPEEGESCEADCAVVAARAALAVSPAVAGEESRNA